LGPQHQALINGKKDGNGARGTRSILDGYHRVGNDELVKVVVSLFWAFFDVAKDVLECEKHMYFFV
jgi:hypothetical protein